jgi:hypothetical protein
MKKPADGLSKLASLVGGGSAAEPPRSQAASSMRADEDVEEKLAEDAQKVLDLVHRLAGDNLFDMQVLVEFCADELRGQIRESLEGEP